MKIILGILVFCLTIMGKANSQTMTTLGYDEIVSIDNIELELIEIVDSRCPKSVNCITAGEAKVTVEVYKDGEFLKQKTLIIYPSGIDKKSASLYISEDIIISGINLLPYPIKPEKIPEENYTLQLIIQD